MEIIITTTTMAGVKRDGKIKKKGLKRPKGETETEPLARGRLENETEVVRQQSHAMRSNQKNRNRLL